MTKDVDLMQLHIINKIGTVVTRGGSRKPTQDRVPKVATERFSLKRLLHNLKK